MALRPSTALSWSSWKSASANSGSDEQKDVVRVRLAARIEHEGVMRRWDECEGIEVL
jgi:hypothetical protein